jgi:D-3-phosphoglycerate dehydrogenase
MAILPDASDVLIAAFTRADPGGNLVRLCPGLPDRAKLLHRLSAARIIVLNETRIDAEILAGCPALTDIIFLGTGAANYVDMSAAVARGITVHTIRGYGDRVVAEHTIALLFAVYRDIAAQDAGIRAGGWRSAPLGELSGKTLGLIGMGAIGSVVARIAQALGLHVIAWARSAIDLPGVRQTDLDTLLAEADIVSLHLAYVPETSNFLNATRLRTMKRGAVLINTARAELTDQAEILAMLHDGHLAGAGLDVFSAEPLPADDPMRQAPRAVLTAHSGWNSPEAVDRLVGEAIAIVRSLTATWNVEP